MGRYLRMACALCAPLYFTTGAGNAADLDAEPGEPAQVELKGPVKAWSWEIGARYWYSVGETGYDLYDDTGSILISRLTYEDIAGHAGETFFRGDHSSGFFAKGYIGAGVVNSGNLIDEDFPPVVDPYSKTISDQDEGSLRYGSLDFGYTFYDGTATSAGLKDEPAGPNGMKLGAFVGFHYLNEKLNAFGCTQLASSPVFCPPGAISPDTKGISQDTDWMSMRLGLAGEFYLTQRLKLSAEAAYVRSRLDAEDTHHQRIDLFGPTPQDGDGDGVQLEAVLSYQVTDAFNLGVGARYWHMQVDGGRMHFEDSKVGGGVPQVLDFETERYGVFVQGSYKF